MTWEWVALILGIVWSMAYVAGMEKKYGPQPESEGSDG